MINSTESVLKQSLYNTINNFGLKLDKAFIVLDNKLNLIYQNEKHVKLTGFSCDEINQNYFKLMSYNQSSFYSVNFQQSLIQGELLNHVVIHQKKNGDSFTAKMQAFPIQNEFNQLMYVLIIIEEIVQQSLVPHLDQNTVNLAFYDATLNIPNRQGLTYHLQYTPNFKTYKNLNLLLFSPGEYPDLVEIYGRDTGDLILKEIINRIQSNLNLNIGLIGRYSSAAIYMLVEGEIDEQLLEQYINSAMATEAIIGGRTFYLTIKAGIAKNVLPAELDEFCRQAEIALIFARKNKGNSIKYYDKNYSERIAKESVLLHHLTAAVRNKEIEVYVQPKIEMHRGRVDSMEALARWNSPTFGSISPAQFIPIAEKAGLIREIDNQILEKVLIWMQQRHYEGKKIIPVAVNISADHFYQPNFVSDLKSLINKYYADPKMIVIEITESLGLEEINQAQHIINELSVFGFQVSVDDFGMGYSSLSYLQKLNFKELKIDMSFVRRLDEVATKAIVQSIIHIAKYLEMRVVAEGVETEQQAAILKELQCDVVQGYLYNKPIPLSDIDL